MAFVSGSEGCNELFCGFVLPGGIFNDIDVISDQPRDQLDIRCRESIWTSIISIIPSVIACHHHHPTVIFTVFIIILMSSRLANHGMRLPCRGLAVCHDGRVEAKPGPARATAFRTEGRYAAQCESLSLQSPGSLKGSISLSISEPLHFPCHSCSFVQAVVPGRQYDISWTLLGASQCHQEAELRPQLPFQQPGKHPEAHGRQRAQNDKTLVRNGGTRFTVVVVSSLSVG